MKNAWEMAPGVISMTRPSWHPWSSTTVGGFCGGRPFLVTKKWHAKLGSRMMAVRRGCSKFWRVSWKRRGISKRPPGFQKFPEKRGDFNQPGNFYGCFLISRWHVETLLLLSREIWFSRGKKKKNAEYRLDVFSSYDEIHSTTVAVKLVPHPMPIRKTIGWLVIAKKRAQD